VSTSARRIVIAGEVLLVGLLLSTIVLAQETLPTAGIGSSSNVNNLGIGAAIVLVLSTAGQGLIKLIEAYNKKIERDDLGKVVADNIQLKADNNSLKDDVDHWKSRYEEEKAERERQHARAEDFREKYNDLRIENAILKGKEPPPSMGSQIR
jgi:hypothetical protein